MGFVEQINPSSLRDGGEGFAANETGSRLGGGFVVHCERGSGLNGLWFSVSDRGLLGNGFVVRRE